MDRLDEMKLLRIAGLTFQEIGRRFGISRQWACYLLKPYGIKLDPEVLRRKEERRREQKREYNKQYGKIRSGAYLRVNGKQVRVQKREKPDSVCEVCGKGTVRLVYHHWDDTYPEKGVWVCPSCHWKAEMVDGKRDWKYLAQYLELKGSITV